MDGDRIGPDHAQQKIVEKDVSRVNLVKNGNSSMCPPALISAYFLLFSRIGCWQGRDSMDGITLVAKGDRHHVRRCTARLVQKMNTEPNSSTTPYLRILVQNTCRLGFRVLYFFS